MANSSISLGDLLELPGVFEHCELKSPKLGVMAYHGGQLEKVTDLVATEVAAASGASLYTVTQEFDPLHHIPSTNVSPNQSEALATFLDHVECVITVHGYGLKEQSRTVLLGGQNRELAAALGDYLSPILPGYEFCQDLEQIPKRLRGQHPNNPVNLPTLTGVQIELPPILRWHTEGWHWSDYGDGGRAPDTQTFIDALSEFCSNYVMSNTGD